MIPRFKSENLTITLTLASDGPLCLFSDYEADAKARDLELAGFKGRSLFDKALIKVLEERLAVYEDGKPCHLRDVISIVEEYAHHGFRPDVGEILRPDIKWLRRIADQEGGK